MENQKPINLQRNSVCFFHELSIRHLINLKIFDIKFGFQIHFLAINRTV